MANIIKKKSDPIDNYHHDAGKGSVYRPTNSEKFDSNWDLIFGKKDKNYESQDKPNQGETK
jgi:hypothetical protein